jgi:hypothetical protein
VKPPRDAAPGREGGDGGEGPGDAVGVEVSPAGPPLPRGASASAGPSAEERAQLAQAPTVYLDWHTSGQIEGLELYVSSLEVKLDTDGREVLRAELRLKAGGEARDASFSGEGRIESFAGYHVQVRGGSRQSVGVAVIRAAKGK